MKYCFACGRPVDVRAEVCPACGVKQRAIVTDSHQQRPASRRAAGPPLSSPGLRSHRNWKIAGLVLLGLLVLSGIAQAINPKTDKNGTPATTEGSIPTTAASPVASSVVATALPSTPAAVVTGSNPAGTQSSATVAPTGGATGSVAASIGAQTLNRGFFSTDYHAIVQQGEPVILSEDGTSKLKITVIAAKLASDDAGNQIVMAHVSYSALADGILVNAGNWQLFADGTLQEPSYMFNSDPSLPLGSLSNGRTAGGWVAFSLPTKFAELRLSFQEYSNEPPRFEVVLAPVIP